MSALSAVAIKRIIGDVKAFQDCPIENCRIIQDEENVFKVYAVICGPKGTIYEDGLYFFEMTFLESYPYQPPEVKFINWQNSSVRMHPNLYKNGKVCLSILGTWSGPSWTSAMDITQIVLSIQSLLDENPLMNEPGYEKNPQSQEHLNYQRIIQWHNIRSFIYHTYKKYDRFMPECFSPLADFILCFYDVQRLYATRKRLERLLAIYPTEETVQTRYQSTSANINYAKMLNDFKNLIE